MDSSVDFATPIRIVRGRYPSGLGRSGIPADRARLHSAALLPTYLDRPAAAMLSRERERGRYAMQEGGARETFMENAAAMYVLWKASWHSIASVVELINIPCSLAARRGTASRFPSK